MPEAARYIGLGTTKFKELVEKKRLPKPKTVGSRKIWDRWELDTAFDALNDDAANDDTWSDVDA